MDPDVQPYDPLLRNCRSDLLSFIYKQVALEKTWIILSFGKHALVLWYVTKSVYLVKKFANANVFAWRPCSHD